MTRLSIIMPVYNAGKYLEKSINSILNQTFTDWELICVDDGSTDDSAGILRQYAAGDPRIRIISQPNRGQGAARNRAMAAVKGEYIGFVDADDSVLPDMYEKLTDSAACHGSDIVLCNITKCFENTGEHKKFKMLKTCSYNNGVPAWKDTAPDEDRLLSRKEICRAVLVIPHYAVNKIYRTGFLQQHKILFTEEKLYEDVVFGLRAMLEAKKVSYVNIFSYFYLIHQQSSVRSVSRRHFYIYDVFREIGSYLEQKYPDGELAENFTFFIYSNILWHYKQVPLFCRFRFVKKAQKLLPQKTYSDLCRKTVFALSRRLAEKLSPVKYKTDGWNIKISLLGIKISFKQKQPRNRHETTD